MSKTSIRTVAMEARVEPNASMLDASMVRVCREVVSLSNGTSVMTTPARLMLNWRSSLPAVMEYTIGFSGPLSLSTAVTLTMAVGPCSSSTRPVYTAMVNSGRVSSMSITCTVTTTIEVSGVWPRSVANMTTSCEASCSKSSSCEVETTPVCGSIVNAVLLVVKTISALFPSSLSAATTVTTELPAGCLSAIAASYDG